MRFILSALTFMTIPVFAYAQTAGFGAFGLEESLTTPESFAISISPQYPRPYDAITITLSSNLLNLAASTASISVDDTVVEEGPSVRTATAIVGAAGEVTRVSATVESAGQMYTKELSVRPADVALIIEPKSSTHPFYKGAGLPVPEGRLRLVAMPDFRSAPGVRIPASELVYTWKLGSRTLQNESGIGKNVLLATGPIRYRDATVTVLVTTPDQSLVAENGVVIVPVDPIVRVYRNDPLLGVQFGQALSGSIKLLGAEETLRVVPYYFETEPAITWTVNSVPSGTSKDITLRATGTGVGTAQVAVSARAPESLQSASQSLSVEFGETQSRGIFGF